MKRLEREREKGKMTKEMDTRVYQKDDQNGKTDGLKTYHNFFLEKRPE
jgi:hypothetical protein